MAKNLPLIILSVLYLFVGFASLAPIVMLPMAFDAPGSENNSVLIAFVLFAASFPLACLLGALLPWIFRRRAFGHRLFLLPVVHLVLLGIVIAAGIGSGLLK